MIRFIAAAALLLAIAAPAEARKATRATGYDNDGHIVSGIADHRAGSGDRRARAGAGAGVAYRGRVVGGRPPGCPARYCGCGTSLKLFGEIRPELNLAANWLRKFPRTRPAPMMVAARQGHVMLLLEHVSGDQWKVWDANSGGGLTRIHVRSIRGFRTVDPGATAVAWQ